MFTYRQGCVAITAVPICWSQELQATEHPEGFSVLTFSCKPSCSRHALLGGKPAVTWGYFLSSSHACPLRSSYNKVQPLAPFLSSGTFPALVMETSPLGQGVPLSWASPIIKQVGRFHWPNEEIPFIRLCLSLIKKIWADFKHRQYSTSGDSLSLWHYLNILFMSSNKTTLFDYSCFLSWF